jgi:hypothetical protein
MADQSKRVLEQVVHENKTAELQQDGKTVAVTRRKAGVSGKELVRRLRNLRFTESERKELTEAMAEGAKALTDVGGA